MGEKFLKKTPLYDTHTRYGAKLIEFGGWLMPVQYSGIIDEHKAVRTAAGLFDLSHMGEVEVSGRHALSFLQYLTTNDVAKLEVGQAQYSLMCYPDGGIVDDLIVYRLPENKYYLVVNASNIAKDLRWIRETSLMRAPDVIIRDVSDSTALIAIQGPKAAEILQPLVNVNLAEIGYFHAAQGQIGDAPALIARTGYTGEDGFELFFNRVYAAKIWDLLAEAGKPAGLLPVGLGARDTLRLESRMSLYGNDLDATTNPLEAGLGWAVKFDKGDFVGRDALVRNKERGLKRKLVGFEMVGRGIARHGYPVVDNNGQKIGIVTSGAPSTSVGKNIGLAYVPTELSKIGTTIKIQVRDSAVEAKVIKTPFYTSPHKAK